MTRKTNGRVHQRRIYLVVRRADDRRWQAYLPGDAPVCLSPALYVEARSKHEALAKTASQRRRIA
jgi:hypothetical protein